MKIKVNVSVEAAGVGFVCCYSVLETPSDLVL